VADFVICNKAFEVQAVIELDDASHKGRELQDEKRISTLLQAGHKVLRYKTVLNIETLQKDLVISSK
jgi:very-short-patch-repair endonuclease